MLGSLGTQTWRPRLPSDSREGAGARVWARSENQREGHQTPLGPPAHAQLVNACPMSATGTVSFRASLTFQQPLGDAEGSHQVLRKVQIGRLLAELGEALGQSCAPEPMAPRTQRHIEQVAWGDRGAVRGDGWLRRSPPAVLTEVPRTW